MPVQLPVGIRRAGLGLLLGAWLATSPSLRAAPTGDGLFATFVMKRGAVSVGEFSCKLEFEKVPRTVANFVGLAEGFAAWIDFQEGHATRRPFFDGLTFQQVLGGLAVKADIPSTDGSDGRPGYRLPDEFDPTLRHDRAGILSMEKSGIHPNGSRFFFTLAAAAVFDNVHSAFGEVVDGMSVFTSIQPGDKIESVTIVRNGPAAQAFTPTAHGVPQVLDAQPVLEKLSPGYRLTYPKPANSETLVFHSDTLADWALLPGEDLEGTTPLTAIRDVSSVTAGKAMHFFNVARVQYNPVIVGPPPDLVGKKLYLYDPCCGWTTYFWLLSSTHGSYGVLFFGSFEFQYTWTQVANVGHLVASSTQPTTSFGFNNFDIYFDFNSPTTGTFSGDWRDGERVVFNWSSTFKVADNP